ncbi:hypothetical protein [Micromonospora okii]|uniref:hypothetical protein n=1 Tax=Micromonospora okii TaxID=1182970 RepID=UPI001E489944|nr:hypothetical protein [Micromonospora okii]
MAGGGHQVPAEQRRLGRGPDRLQHGRERRGAGQRGDQRRAGRVGAARLRPLARPGGWAATSGMCALAVVLVIPVALPILAGYALAALHAVARRHPTVAVEPS